MTSGEDDDLYWRSAMSGGRATIAIKQGKKVPRSMAGDVAAVHPKGHLLTEQFLVECKSYRDLKLQNLVKGKWCTLIDFWIVACNQVLSIEKWAMLIAKKNNHPPLLCIHMVLAGHVLHAGVIMPYAMLARSAMNIYHLEEFLDKVDPHVFLSSLPNVTSNVFPSNF